MKASQIGDIFMWDSYQPKRKPFFLRLWFLIPVGLIVLALGTGGVIFLMAKGKLEKQAAAFDYSRLESMESASVIYDRNGVILGRLFTQNRDQVGVEKMSPALLTEVVAAEDARFYQHRGVDYRGILRAMLKNYRAGKTVQGASTLAQQLARNTFPDLLPPQDRSYQRKLLELAVAWEIERRCDKQKILELYLNRVFFGSGFFGVQAAAKGYFGKDASDLNLSESAMLCGLLKSPTKLSPWRNREACIEARNYVLSRAKEIELVTLAEYEQALKSEIVVKNRRPIHQESYAADIVAQEVAQKFGRGSAMSDGYRIYTTIDGQLQKVAEKSLKEQLNEVERQEGFAGPLASKFEQEFKQRQRQAATIEGEIGAAEMPDYLQGGIVVMENKTGGILALVGGREFTHSPYNRAISARRPAGTAFLPFVYAAGFEKGLSPGTIVEDAQMDNRQVMIGGETGILGEWGPERLENKYEGKILAQAALVHSKNAATVRFGMMAGIDSTLALAKKAGIESPLRKFPATFLGSSEVTLMEMTLANTTFPNGGTRPEKSFIIDRIEDKNGKVVYRAVQKKVEVMRETTAVEINSCLAEVLNTGTGDRIYSEYGVKKLPLGGKTGTAYNFTDVWFLGYSSAVTCGVWVGFDKPRPIYSGAFSNKIAMPIWAEVMKATFAGYSPKSFLPPRGMIQCEICKVSGQLATAKCFEPIVDKQTGEKSTRPTTTKIGCTDEQAPKLGCVFHGGAVEGAFVKASPTGDIPRAVLAVSVTDIPTVKMKGDTVIGVDPYNSMAAIANAVAMKAFDGQIAPITSSTNVPKVKLANPDQVEIRRAEPVRPTHRQSTVVESPIQLDPPDPIIF